MLKSLTLFVFVAVEPLAAELEESPLEARDEVQIAGAVELGCVWVATNKTHCDNLGRTICSQPVVQRQIVLCRDIADIQFV